jgi:hypothetical protein
VEKSMDARTRANHLFWNFTVFSDKRRTYSWRKRHSFAQATRVKTIVALVPFLKQFESQQKTPKDYHLSTRSSCSYRISSRLFTNI